MSRLTFYGTNVAHSLLTQACVMTNIASGVETSKETTVMAGGNFAETTSQGLTVTSVSAIPATPTLKGWVAHPGAGTFDNTNWSLIHTIDPTGWSGSSTTTKLTGRLFKYSSGVLTLIGSFPDVNVTGGTFKTTYNFTDTAFGNPIFGQEDLIYHDLWFFDGTGAGGDNPVIFESNASSSGVANDVQLTTSGFTPSTSKTRIYNGYGGMFL